MSNSPEIFAEEGDSREARATAGAERLSTLTPIFELARGEGYRWASLDVADLDPPTPLLPYAAV